MRELADHHRAARVVRSLGRRGRHRTSGQALRERQQDIAIRAARAAVEARRDRGAAPRRLS